MTNQELKNIYCGAYFFEETEDGYLQSFQYSKEQMKYVTNTGPGEGLIRYDKVLLPFTDHFPTNTRIYSLINTKPNG